MQGNIEVYLEGPMDERVRVLTHANGPFVLAGSIYDIHVLRSKHPDLDGVFLCGSPEEKMLLEEPHCSAQSALELSTGCQIHYRSELNAAKIAALKNVMDVLAAPFYITLKPDCGNEILIRGKNVRSGAEISNAKFIERMPKLL